MAEWAWMLKGGLGLVGWCVLVLWCGAWSMGVLWGVRVCGVGFEWDGCNEGPLGLWVGGRLGWGCGVGVRGSLWGRWGGKPPAVLHCR